MNAKERLRPVSGLTETKHPVCDTDNPGISQPGAGNPKPTSAQLFWTFLKIGAFTIGGGYAMVPLIQREVVDRGWMDEEEFVGLLGLAQAAPGILAMNVAVFVGYKVLRMKGVFVAAVASVFPSFVIILTIALVFKDFKDAPAVERVFKGMRPAVVALIALPLVRMVKTVGLTWKTAFIPLLALLLIYFIGVSPAWTVLMAAGGGIIYSWLRKR